MAKSSELRARARKALGGNIFTAAWLWTLLACFLANTANTVAAMLPIVGLAASFVVYGPIKIGLQGYIMKLVRGEKAELADLLDGFKQNFGRNFLLGLMEQVFILLWSLLFIIPGIVKTYAYSMAYYIQNDHPEYTWRECLSESQRMMKGNKWKLFCLQLSFIGWSIVAVFIPFGIGGAFLAPYTAAANAEFYEELKGI